MEQPLYLIISFSAGIALGTFYFLSLWKTLQRISEARNPGVVLLRSYIIRTAVVLAGFYLIMDGQWERVVAALLGFVLMRMILTRRLGKERLVS